MSKRILAVVGCGLAFVAAPARAQPAADRAVKPAAQDGSTASGNDGRAVAGGDILAWVGKQAITRADVDFQLGRQALKQPPPLSHSALQTTIHLMAQQRQTLQTLRELKVAAGREEVETWLESHSEDAEGRRRTAAEIVAEVVERFGIEETAYWDWMAFRLSWKRYLAKHLTEENLARHFQNEQTRFDGSRFKVLMVSSAVPAGDSAGRDAASEALRDAPAWKAAELDPAKVRAEAKQRGWHCTEEKWVRGSGSLESAAVDALLQLEPGQRSPPVHTAAGVHLIYLQEKEAGDLSLEQVRDEVRAHMLVFLLEHLAAQSRQQLPLRANH